MSLLDYAKDIVNNPDKYAKLYVALGGAVLNLLLEYFPDAKWLQPIVALLTAYGVFQVPNKK